MKHAVLRAGLFGILLAGCVAEPVPLPSSDGAGRVAARAEPCAAVAAASETVRVANDFGRIEGTLEVPEGCGPLPVVLILSGSGTSDRNGNVPGEREQPHIYRVLSETLVAAGFAVLRYDDAGIAGSVSGAPAKVEDFRFDHEVADAARFVAELRKDARFGAVVVAGHSQGSLTGIMANQLQPIDALISLAGTGRPIAQLLREQLEKRLSEQELALLDAALAKLQKGELVGKLAAPLDSILPVEQQPYMISWMRVRPEDELRKLKVPTLIVQGKMDLQVQELDAELLFDAKPDATLTLVDDMGHMLRQVRAKTAAAQKDSYAKALPLHPAAVTAMSDFIAKVGAVPKR